MGSGKRINTHFSFFVMWLEGHARYLNTPIYISGDSYSGMVVPIIVQEIINGNKAGFHPLLNIQGYILGNPSTRKEDTSKSKIIHGHRLSLISDELYKKTKRNCKGNLDESRVENIKCSRNLQEISSNLKPLFNAHVLKHKCISNQTLCQESIYQLLFYWANNRQVHTTLGIHKGSKDQWIRCNTTSAYERNIESVVGYHKNLTREVISALIYSGDQDLVVPYVGTLEWIKMLNISTIKDWSPWFVSGQVAGYTLKFSNGHYHVTYANVKGAGHTAPEYKRQECLAMLETWLTMNTL